MMMISRRFLLLALVCLTTSTHGFIPTRKKSTERRAAFSKQSNDNVDQDEAVENVPQTTQYEPGASPTAMMAIPPNAMAYAASLYEYEEEEEQDVSNEIALISCIISLAIGFGTGYLV